jgi:hypothetical protein
MQRRRFKQIQSLEERLSEEAKRLREEANSLPPGPQQEDFCAEPAKPRPAHI